MRYRDFIDEFMSTPRYHEPAHSRQDLAGETWGIMLLNMGGPDTLDDIEPYLYNLFCDRNIIRLPLSFLTQKPLAKFISSRRTIKVRERYKLIGGGSPQLKWTRLEAEGMIRNLTDDFPGVRAYIGMRYTKPFIAEELSRAMDDGCTHMLLLPLYPHYTLATTGTSIEVVLEWLSNNRSTMTVSLIPHWHTHPRYIELLKKKISGAFGKIINRDAVRLLFSAHSLPVSLIAAGDPYERQINETAALAGKGYDYLLAYQSQTGPVKWLGPPTPEVIRQQAAAGVKDIVIVPISFVSDHIETLHEIDIEFRDYADESGIENFIRTESFNDDPDFGILLETLVREHIYGNQPNR